MFADFLYFLICIFIVPVISALYRIICNKMFEENQLTSNLEGNYPLKRLGKPEDIAYGAIYLLSDASSWVTGTNLVIDGGFILN